MDYCCIYIKQDEDIVCIYCVFLFFLIHKMSSFPDVAAALQE